MNERLEQVVATWLERVLAGERPEPERFAAEHGVPLAQLLPLLENARWLVGRHRDQRDPQPPRLPALPFDLGDVHVVEEAGRGGMGIVFRGVQRSLGRPVAVKVLGAPHQDLESRSRPRFLREARAAARLSHPHVVRVLLVGEDQGLAWFAMEWIEGESLARILARRRAATTGAPPRPPTARGGDPRETALLFAKVARALQHAHEHGLLHRDVKPGNILVDVDGEPHLADFGLVRDMVEPGLTVTGERLGSPPYMSPEQVRGDRALTPRTDVYSLGVALYECLTLARPFPAEETTVLRAQILHAPVVRPRALDRRVPEDLQWICLKAMARENHVRYPSAAAFAADLEAYVRGEPVHAGPPSLWLRGRRLLRRHGRGALLAGALVAVAALGWSAWRNQASLRAAELASTRARVVLSRLTEDRGRLVATLGDAIRSHPGEPLFLLERAIPLLGENRVEQATRDLEQARSLAPADEEVAHLARALRAAAALASGRPPEAEESAALQWAATAETRRAAILHLRGLVLAFLGRWHEAEPLLRRARDLDGSSGAEGDLATVYLRMGRMTEAWLELDRFTSSRQTPYVLAVRCRLRILGRDLEGAAAELARLQERAPSSAFTAAARISILAITEGDAEELEALHAGARQASDWKEAEDAVTRALADAWHLRKRPSKAIPLFEILVAKQPGDANLRSVLGICLHELASQRRGAQARDLLRRALAELEQAARASEHQPLDRDYHLGMFHFFSERLPEAVACLRDAVAKEPGDPRRQRPLAIALNALAERTEDPADKLALLREHVEVHQRETRLAPRDGRARELHRHALLRLADALERAGDPSAADVRRQADALGPAAGR